jgi:hypothetical protein
MKIIGFGIEKISAERKKQIKGKLEIKNGLNIDEISAEKVNISDKPSLKFDFSYNVRYEPGFAEIMIKGSLICLDDKGESAEILKDWKDKKFTHDVKFPILNYILEECTIRALQLEKDVAIPSHMPFPKLKKENKTPASYTG